MNFKEEGCEGPRVQMSTVYSEAARDFVKKREWGLIDQVPKRTFQYQEQGKGERNVCVFNQTPWPEGV
jgi:hypothetical protein